MEKAVEWGMKICVFEWHGTGVQTQDSGVDWGGCFREMWGTPAYQVHLIVCWDMWESVGAKTIGFDLHLEFV